MHVPPGVQPCPSCYAYCVPRGPPIPGAPPVPRHAHPPPMQQSPPRVSPSSSPHQSPHRTQPRPIPHPQVCNHQSPMGGPRFGSLPHNQPIPKVPPHYNSLPHHQPPPPAPPSHLPPCSSSHPTGGCEIPGPPLPPHGSLPPGKPHVIMATGLRHAHHFPPPNEAPPPPPPPHAMHPCQPQQRCPPTSQAQPYYGNMQLQVRMAPRLHSPQCHPQQALHLQQLQAHPQQVHPQQSPNHPQQPSQYMQPQPRFPQQLAHLHQQQLQHHLQQQQQQQQQLQQQLQQQKQHSLQPPHPQQTQNLSQLSPTRPQQSPPHPTPQSSPPNPHPSPPHPQPSSPHPQPPSPHPQSPSPHPPQTPLLMQQAPHQPPHHPQQQPHHPQQPPHHPQQSPLHPQQQQHHPQQQMQLHPQQQQQHHPQQQQQHSQQQQHHPQQILHHPQPHPLHPQQHPLHPQQHPHHPQACYGTLQHLHQQQQQQMNGGGNNHHVPPHIHPQQGGPQHAHTITTSGYASCYGHVPRPPPLPPPRPPPPTFQQLRYGCLPHQQLVPPPPPPPPLQQQLRFMHHQQLYGCFSHNHHHHLIDLVGSGSPVKVDRGYCGKGPPGSRVGPSLTKAYSIEGGAPPVPPHHLHHTQHHHHHNGNQFARRPQQAMSQSSGMGMGGRRQGPRGTAADDSGNRGSRWRGSGAPPTGQGYELSQDLADMRLEMLERRYGGEVARRAAVTIQRAYRHYAMYKKFRSITATAKAQEKRLSRRFTVDVPEWTDSTGQHCTDAEHFIRSEFDQLQRNISATVYGEGRRPARSLSMRDHNRSSSTPTTSSTTTTKHQDNYDLHDTLASMNDSSLYCHVSAQSPLTPTSTPTPAPTHVRNGSGDYQSQQTDLAAYACSRDLKSFSSEDSGLGSQDGTNQTRVGTGGRNRIRVVGGKKVPPEVPRRSSSIKSCESSTGSVDSAAAFSTANHRVQCHPPSLTPPSSTPSSLNSEGGHSERGALRRSADNGSLSSVQSSGSDSSLSQSASDRATPLSTHDQVDNSDPTSPVWKRKNQMSTSEVIYEDKRLSNISENSEDSLQSHSSEGMTYSQTIPSQIPHSARYANANYTHTSHTPKVPEVVRKRQYRVGLNLFNKKPERGITYLIGRGFLENSSQAVAKFLLTRKGLSKQMIGEYLGNLQNSFNMAVLECFAQEIDLSGMQVDVALRKFQTHFRMPGEAQKIERLMQVFAQRYCQCNRDIVAKLRDPETIFVLAFAIIMLNTDLHTASMKQEKRMKLEDFVKNLRGIDDGYDIEREMLEGMYQRIKSQEFRPGHDHVTQVLKVQQTMVGKKPNLALPHRRLVCYCRLYEIPDITKKERVGVHQREVFLFNDLLVVTKIFSKKKNSVTYTFRQSFPLAGLSVSTKEVPHYPYLMEIRQRVDSKLLITFNARNEHDRTKFCEDLKESVCEMDEMENLRIEGELERQKASLRASRPNSTAENRDSGVADMELMATSEKNGTLKSESNLKRSALSNSLLDIHEAEGGGRSVRRGSVGSLDSGMSVSFQSTSASNDTSPAGGPQQSLTSSDSQGDLQHQPQPRRSLTSNSSFLGQLFRPRRSSRPEIHTAGVEV